MKHIREILNKMFGKENDELATTAVAQDMESTEKPNKIVNALFDFIFAFIVFIVFCSTVGFVERYVGDGISIISAILFAIYQYISSKHALKPKASKFFLTVLMAISVMILGIFNFLSYISDYSNFVSTAIVIWNVRRISK